MRQCGFLTTDDISGYVSDDHLAIRPLRELGWEARPVSWRRSRDWSDLDVVVIRSTWDYQNHLPPFLRVLEEIDRSTARLLNPLELVRWNARKTYLRDLAALGVAVVPTVWGDRLDIARLDAYFRKLGADEIVLKPVVSANAYRTHRVRREESGERISELTGVFDGTEHLAQPFLRQVVDEGEYSVIFLGGEPSHAVLKTPGAGDFRVQEEHGGTIRGVDTEPELVAFGRRVMESLSTPPFYGRVDVVRSGDGGFLLMELELIEPSLYLRMRERAPERFARALDAWMGA